MTTPTMIPTITMVERKPPVVSVVDCDGVGVVEVGVVEDMSVVGVGVVEVGVVEDMSVVEGVGVTEEVEDGEGKSIERKKLTIFVISSYMYQ